MYTISVATNEWGDFPLCQVEKNPVPLACVLATRHGSATITNPDGTQLKIRASDVEAAERAARRRHERRAAKNSRRRASP